MCLTSLSQHVIFQIELVGLCSRKFYGNREFKHQFYSNLRQSCKFSGTNQTWTNQWKPLGHVDPKWSSFSTHWRRHQPVLNNAALVIDESLWICRTCNLQKTEALAVYLSMTASLNTCHRVGLAAQWTHFRMGLIRAHGLCFLQWLMSEDMHRTRLSLYARPEGKRLNVSNLCLGFCFCLGFRLIKQTQQHKVPISVESLFKKTHLVGFPFCFTLQYVCMYVMLCNVM